MIAQKSLQIKEDSTYKVINCGNVITGNWVFRTDSLILYCKDNRFINDSLNRFRTLSCGSQPVRYFINRNGELIHEETLVTKKIPYKKDIIVFDNLIKEC